MKLQKIKEIKGYKSFRDFSWQVFFNNENLHEDLNLIYAENGAGKTSLCNILKSVSDEKDFHKVFPEEIKLKTDTDDFLYTDRTWSANIPHGNIIFFDKEFVDKHVHAGHERGTRQGEQEQESGKLVIEFDQTAHALREKRDQAKEKRDLFNQQMTDFLNEHNDTLNFELEENEKALFLKFKNKSKEEIQEYKKTLNAERKELEKRIDSDGSIQEKIQEIQDDIDEIDEEDYEYQIEISEMDEYKDVFTFQLEKEIKAKATQSLINKIKEHSEFFEEGFDIREEHPEVCPFCQSKNEEEGIKKVIDAYNEIYDDTYKKQLGLFSNKKRELINEFQELEDLVTDFNKDAVFHELKRLQEKYNIKNIYSLKEEQSFNKPKISKLKELKTKIKSLEKPSNEDISSLYEKFDEEMAKVQEYFDTLLEYIQKKNKIILKFKEANTGEKIGARIAKASQRVGEIENQLTFFAEKYIDNEKKRLQKDKELKELEIALQKLKEEYKEAREGYEAFCSSEVFIKLLEKIEEYFAKFDFDFKLKLDSSRGSVHTKEFPFAFKILDASGSERDFKEGLSEGEWQVLALCFFFAFLDVHTDKTDKILVFDDPITSLDNSNLSSLVTLIGEEYQNFSQTMIFTHHRTFFKFLKKRFRENCNEYNIIKNNETYGGSFICKSKSNKFIEKLKNLENHLVQVAKGEGFNLELKVVEYGQYLRYEVEWFIKNDILHWDAEGDFTLALKGIRSNKNISEPELMKIQEIYSFCNWTTSHVDVGEDFGLNQLKAKIRDFVGIWDNYHTSI